MHLLIIFQRSQLTFTEGVSYGVVILAGLGIAGVAAYAVLTGLVFEPKE